MPALPTSIQQSGPEQLAITWSDGREDVHKVFDLRIACPCAKCTKGEQPLDPAAIREDVRPVRIESMGHYALKITWTDGHDTGIYSFELLRRLGDSAGS